MNWKTAGALCLLLAAVALFALGCAEVEPRTGTKVVFSMPTRGAVPREKIAETCTYLMKRSRKALGMPRPRVESVSDDSLVLLLPGKKVSREDTRKLVETSSIELYRLGNVATGSHPERPWKLKPPAGKGKPFLFLGPDAKRIDSQQDAKDLLAEVVGYPKEKPIVTGKDILPTAMVRDVRSGWAVLIQFNPKGSKAFYEFTKSNPGEYLAVFYNGDLIFAPKIEKPVEGGQVFITGFKSADEAQALVDDINTGALPMGIRIKSVSSY